MWLPLVAAVALVGSTAAVARAGSGPPPSLVEISGRAADGRQGFGAGVIVAAGNRLTIVTAAHVAGMSGLRVTTTGGERLSVVSVREIAGYDMAFVVTNRSVQEYVPAQFADARADDGAVVVWGFPFSDMPKASDGRIISTAMVFPDGTTHSHLALDCTTCDHGDSGGGVFAADGRLIGIVTTRWNASTSSSVVEAEPHSALTAALNVAVK